MNTENRKPGGKRKLFSFLSTVLFLVFRAAFTVFAEEATPLYSFEYQGSTIDTYATYSVVDGVKTDGFRYFVKDGKLLVVDNDLNPAADGIFIHYEDGESYIGVLTKGGHLVSLGTVELAEHLENFKDSGISEILSNVKDHSKVLTVCYINGAVVGYDVVTGKELYRSGGTESSGSFVDYITEYLENMIKSTSATSDTSARAEADEIASIMNEHGYTLEELAENGVFSSSDSLNDFVENGVLSNENTGESSAGGSGGSGETGADAEKSTRTAGETKAADGLTAGNGTEAETRSGAETEDGEEEEESREEEESSAEESGETKIISAEVLKKGTSLTGKTSETKASSEKETKTAQKDSEKESKAASEKTADTAGKKTTEKETESSSLGSAVLKKKDSTAGKAAGTKTGTEVVESAGESGSENGSGTASGTDTSLNKKEDVTGKETEAEDGKKTSENGKTSGTENESREDNKETGASGDTSGEDGKETSGEKRLLSEKSGYVPVYNPDTGSYEIYSVSELLENPEDPKSENAKLDNADNRAIAALLKVREDENNERGISLYAVVIAAVIGLMAQAVLYIVKRSGREERQEAERKAADGAQERKRPAEQQKKGTAEGCKHNERKRNIE